MTRSLEVVVGMRPGSHPPPPPPPTNFPAGLIPNRVIAGWYAAESGSFNNDPDHAAVLMDPRNDSIAPGAWWQGSSDFAKTIPSGLTKKQTPAYKQFNQGGFISTTDLLANLATADAKGYYLVQTTKVPAAPGGRISDASGNPVNDYDWLGVSQGNYDSVLRGYAQIAADRIAAGKRGFFLTFHHEPNGDWTTSLSTLAVPPATRQTWAAMQTYCSWFFGGRRGGTASSPYVAANDMTDGMSWGCVPNGFQFTGSLSDKQTLDAIMPPSLITAFNANQGIVAVDIYDNTTANKTLVDKVDAVYKWCTSPSSRSTAAAQAGPVLNHAGIAEMGAYSASALQLAWESIYAKVDLYRFAIYWDSGIGQVPSGATDWRLVPSGYPADSDAGANPAKPFVGPGTTVTGALYKYWRDTAVLQSEAMR